MTVSTPEGKLEDATDESLARLATAGDRDAVERLVRRVQPYVYALALRILWQRQDAEDATQEILIRVLTRLSRFDGRSQFRTWVYRVATNYLLDLKKRPLERMTFEHFAEDLSEGLAFDGIAEAERSVAVEEVRIGCTMALLQCLDRGHRLAYVLGEIVGLPPDDAAEALALEPAAFRKRLQRARDRVEAFTREHCGLVSDQAACRCNRRVATAVRLGRVRPDDPTFASSASSFVEARAWVRKATRARRVVELQRRTQPQGASIDLARRILSALEPQA